MSRLLRIIAHETEHGVNLDILTADAAKGISIPITSFQDGMGAAMAIMSVTEAFFHTQLGRSIPEALEWSRKLKSQVDQVNKLTEAVEGNHEQA